MPDKKNTSGKQKHGDPARAAAPESRAGARSSGGSERGLLDSARNGDPAALDRIVEILAGPAYRFGRTFCRNPHDAEDVMQDVLTAAVRGVGTFAGRGSLTTWAYVVARNACSHMRRRKVGQPSVVEPIAADKPHDEAGHQITDPRADPVRDLYATEIGEAVRRALAGLPRVQREAVLLRDIEGVSTVRAAAILNIDERALKSRLHRGRTALRKALRSHYCDSPGASLKVCRQWKGEKVPPLIRRAVRSAVKRALSES